MQMTRSLLALLLAVCPPGSQAMRGESERELKVAELKIAGNHSSQAEDEADVLRGDDFNSLKQGDKFFNITDTRIFTAPGDREGKALRVTFKPNSAKHTEKWAINRTMAAKVSFDVYFDEGFEFVKGGKLGFGLFGGSPTGCNQKNGFDGWSARVTWGEDGTFKLYYYHQGHQNQQRCGDSQVATFANGTLVKLKAMKWYKFALRVKVNDLYGDRGNGMAVLSLDGAVVVKKTNLRWRLPPFYEKDFEDTEDSRITGTDFKTFYGGGSDKTFAPSNKTRAFFDNYLVVNEDFGHGYGFCRKGTLSKDGFICCGGDCEGKCGNRCKRAIWDSDKKCESRDSTGCEMPNP